LGPHEVRLRWFGGAIVIHFGCIRQPTLLRLVLACTLLAACSADGDADLYPPLDPGFYYEIDPDIIREVVFSSADLKLFAYRWAPDDNFRIVVLRPGEADIERCDAGETFRKWFDMITRMPIGRKLEQPVDPKAGNWAILELIEATVLEGAESRLRLPATAGEPMIWQFGPDQYPVEWDTAAFAGLQSGCAELS
jgi:hypothetical protein